MDERVAQLEQRIEALQEIILEFNKNVVERLSQMETDIEELRERQEVHERMLHSAKTAAERAYEATQERYPGIYPKRSDAM